VEQRKVFGASGLSLGKSFSSALKVYLLSSLLSACIFTYTIIVAALAILGHLSAASLATGPRISEPFISPSGVIITAALSSN
jgi:hypothetical protein